MGSGKEGLTVAGGDEWETPDSLFTAYDWEFAFSLDAAAQGHNAKLPTFATDGLVQSWSGERVWCNPPYSDIEPWIAKGAAREADVAVFLLPVRADTDWWHRYVQDPETGQVLADGLRLMRRRVRFVGARGSPSWASCLVIYRRRFA